MKSKDRLPIIKPKDWFEKAVTYQGSVQACLSFVISDLHNKQIFVAALITNLCDPNHNKIDRLSFLGKKVKELENTLRFRLGLLREDHHGAWFRNFISKDFGPFKSSILTNSVFLEYDIKDISLLKSTIEINWKEKTSKPLPFKTSTNKCLWDLCLSYNEELENLAKLPKPFDTLRLDVLPEGLPEEFESKYLRAFLINISNEFKAIRKRLEICYNQLWNASDSLWKNQIQKDRLVREAALKRQAAKKAQQHKSDKQSTELYLTPQEIYALKFMGFKSRPTQITLKKRYHHLAKKYHPDFGGNEEAFKQLTKSYNFLTKKIA